MEYVIVLMLICATAIPAGAQSRWPWNSSADAATVKLFEQVVAPAKESPALSSLFLPPLYRPLRTVQITRFLQSKGLQDGGYEVVDQATRREAVLQKARERAVRISGNASSETTKAGAAATFGVQSELVYHALRLRLRLALAFSKVTVAKRMASPQNKSYSVQAMESGIDCVRDAARELEAMEKTVKPAAGEVTSNQLWGLHRRLLDIWDTAKKRDDMSLIRDTDLGAVAKEALTPAGG